MNEFTPLQQAAVTKSFYFHKEHIGCTVVAEGAIATDEIDVHYVERDGTIGLALKDVDGNDVVITAATPELQILTARNLMFVKGVTTAAVGLNIHGME